MNTKQASGMTISRWAAIAGLILGAATAQADMLSPTFYGNELDRCAAKMRSELNMAGAARLQHELTEIDKVGVWYVIDIRTTAFDDTDTVMAEAATQCKAHRWTEETVVEVTKQPRTGTDHARVASTD